MRRRRKLDCTRHPVMYSLRRIVPHIAVHDIAVPRKHAADDAQACAIGRIARELGVGARAAEGVSVFSLRNFRPSLSSNPKETAVASRIHLRLSARWASALQRSMQRTKVSEPRASHGAMHDLRSVVLNLRSMPCKLPVTWIHDHSEWA